MVTTVVQLNEFSETINSTVGKLQDYMYNVTKSFEKEFLKFERDTTYSISNVLVTTTYLRLEQIFIQYNDILDDRKSHRIPFLIITPEQLKKDIDLLSLKMNWEKLEPAWRTDDIQRYF